MSNRKRDDLVEFDPDNIDSTVIRYLNLDQCTRAELYVCIEKLLAEVKALESELAYWGFGPQEVSLDEMIEKQTAKEIND